jgi:hypothetical protein
MKMGCQLLAVSKSIWLVVPILHLYCYFQLLRFLLKAES